MQTVDELIRTQAGNERTGLVFSDRTWSHDQVLRAQAERAAALAELRAPGPFHLALLLDNVPEYVFWMGAAALAGAVLVGGNPTHRGDELARDLAHTECQLLVTSSAHRLLVEGHDLGPALPPERILVVDHPSGDIGPDGSGGPAAPGATGDTAYGDLLARVAGASLPDREDTAVDEETLGLLLFTSGTSGAPKACL
ncbi:MAG: AMP-binding protein, partial [Acidimicrobiales bacterium]